jgi:EAL domain-containing protein (putative c-di-GMP-specific phosphodiesterase class I)
VLLVENPSSSRGAPPVVWHLHSATGDRAGGWRVAVRPLPFHIGRAARVDLTLTSESVSNEHAEIYADGDRLRIRDLGSTNGTFVNGLRVLDSPIYSGDLVRVADVTLRLVRQPQVPVPDGRTQKLSEGQLPVQLAHAQALPGLLRNGNVRPLFQPVVNLVGGESVGYEALGRGAQDGLPEAPEELFRVASGLGAEGELSRLFRDKALAEANGRSSISSVFLNTHPTELSQPGLLESLAELRVRTPKLGMTLEINEWAVTRPDGIARIRRELADIGIGLAYDDFGAGQARLLELGDVPPDFLKFDMSFVRGIDRAASSRQRLVASLVTAARDLGACPLAEGVETPGEAEVCTQLGFTHAQGFHFGRPVAADAIQ